jgi:hypothetical protein
MIDYTEDQMKSVNQYLSNACTQIQAGVFNGCVEAMLTILPGPPSAQGPAER